MVEDEGLDRRRRRRGGVCTKIYVEISGKTNRVIRSVYRDNISQPHTPLILVVVVFLLDLLPGDLQQTIKTGYTCEGEELFIQCEEDETIQIVRANYGRFSIAICNEDGKTHWSVNCMSPKTRHILQNR